MSDKEETSTSKRPHETEEKPDKSDESSDDWVGPLPTEAVPVKKRKGNYCDSTRKTRRIYEPKSEHFSVI